MKYQTLIVSALLLVSSSAAQVQGNQAPVNNVAAPKNNGVVSKISGIAYRLANTASGKVKQIVHNHHKKTQIQAPGNKAQQPKNVQQQNKQPVNAPVQNNKKPVAAPVSQPPNNANQNGKRGFLKTVFKVGKGLLGL